MCLANKACICVSCVGALDGSWALLSFVHVSVIVVLGMTLQRFLPNTVKVCGLFLRLQNGPLVSFLPPVPQYSLSEFLALSHQNASKITVHLSS